MENDYLAHEREKQTACWICYQKKYLDKPFKFLTFQRKTVPKCKKEKLPLSAKYDETNTWEFSQL